MLDYLKRIHDHASYMQGCERDLKKAHYLIIFQTFLSLSFINGERFVITKERKLVIDKFPNKEKDIIVILNYNNNNESYYMYNFYV